MRKDETVSVSAPSVMFVNGSLWGGGAERVIATLARHLRASGHRVSLALIHGGGEVLSELVADGFEVVPHLANGGAPFRRLKALIEERGIEVVHSHDLRSLIEVGICRLQRRQFAHVHTFHFGNYPHVSWKHLMMEAVSARIPDRRVAVGNAQRDSLVKALRLPARRIQTIWNGVDWSARPARGESWVDHCGPIIGSVSTIGEQKGLPTLLRAAQILRSRGLAFHLVIVGEGPLRPELERMTVDLGLKEHVTFTGWKPDAAETLLPRFDIFVQSSYWEAMSMVILEAMAARRPIVATTVGENAAVLSHNESAILVPPKDAQALADGLASLITDPARRRRLADVAHASYMQHFTGKAMAERYAAAYRECARRRTVAGAGQRFAVTGL